MVYFLIKKQQYWGKIGDTFYVDSMIDKNIGEKFISNEVLLYKGQVGQPLLKNISVECEIIKHGKCKKLYIIKMIPQKRHRKRTGFRKKYTYLKITNIKET